MQWCLARTLSPRLYTVSNATAFQKTSTARLSQAFPSRRRNLTALFTKHSSKYGKGSQASSNASSYMLPLGVVGGVAFYLYGKRKAPVYCDALVDRGGQEASMRLQLLHAQAGQVSRKAMDEVREKVGEVRAAETISQFGFMVKLLAPECWLLLGVALTAVGAAVVNLWTPVVMGDLINVIARGARLVAAMDDSVAEALGSAAKRLLGLFVANGLLTFTHTTLVAVLGERLGLRLHTQAMNRLLAHDLAFFDRAQSGELVARLTSDIGEFQSTFKKLVTQGVKSATLAVGVGFQLVRLSPTLTLALASTMPAAYVGLALYGRMLRRLRRDAREWEAVSSGIAGEAIGNMRTVRALGAEAAELSLYRESRQEAATRSSRFGLHMGAFRGLTNTAIGCMVLVVLHTGGRLVARGDMTPGDLMAFMVATQAAQRALDALGGLMGQSVRARGALARVLEIVSLTPSVSPIGGTRLDRVGGHVRFMDVDFAYPLRPKARVLEHFNLDIAAGQVVALCGLSGSGKSTVAALLERFYEPTAGEIWLDACPLKKLDMQWLRSQIGYIPQEPALFSTSIRENLRLANPNATDTQIQKACEQANAHGFISALPNGYDTVVGERGTLLSGGQKQRLSIARAILRDPKILILDEATSSLDAESERLVQSALDRLMVGRTVLVIAHRLTTIRNADRIVVMGNVPGHIVEQGTHDELLSKRGAYYRLYTDSNGKLDHSKNPAPGDISSGLVIN